MLQKYSVCVCVCVKWNRINQQHYLYSIAVTAESTVELLSKDTLKGRHFFPQEQLLHTIRTHTGTSVICTLSSVPNGVLIEGCTDWINTHNQYVGVT